MKIVLPAICVLSFAGYLLFHTTWPAAELSGYAVTILCSRILLLSAVALMFYYSYIRKHSITNFFLLPESPYNLAICRLFIFAFPAFYTLAWNVDYSNQVLSPWIDMPLQSRVALPWAGYYTMHVPVSRHIIGFIEPVFKLVTILSFLGLFTRVVVPVYAALALYIFSIPQLFGNPFCQHYVVWFPLVLAFTDCGKVFSLDYLIKTNIFKKKLPDQKSIAYGFPLKTGMLLVGLIYFFPGFWKVWTCGLDWVFSGNLRNLMYSYWIQLNGWEPVVRIDKSGFLMTLAAGLTVIFELGFIFVLPFTRLRNWLALAGLLFHLSILLFMKLNFFDITAAYAFLIDWSKIFNPRGAPAQNAITVPAFGRYISKNIPAVFVCVTLLFGNTLFGFMKLVSWPFACFPTFDNMLAPQQLFVRYQGFRNGAASMSDTDIRSPMQKNLRVHEVTAHESKIIDAWQVHDSIVMDKEISTLLLPVDSALALQADSINILLVESGLSPEERKIWKNVQLIYAKRISVSPR